MPSRESKIDTCPASLSRQEQPRKSAEKRASSGKCSKREREPRTPSVRGQTPGTTVYFHVLACDQEVQPNGQTAYTAWVAVVVTA